MIQTAQSLTAISLGLYCLAMLLYGLQWAKSSRALRFLSPTALVAGLAVNLFQLVHRWLQADQPPFKTLYESLVLLAICIALVYLAVEVIYRARAMGVLGALGSTGTMLYAFFRHDKEVVNLPPALQSGWFIPHVVIYFFGYAALFIAAAASLLYLAETAGTEESTARKVLYRTLLFPYYLMQKTKELVTRLLENRADMIPGGKLDLESLLDNAVRFGFGLLTVGLLVGALWAREAWGDYWVWDPKETWSLVTWLVFGLYLHLHYLSGWRGRRLAALVLIGFGAVMFTYLGMHLLPTAEQSAHVYQ